MRIALIAAFDSDRGIGRGNSLPWSLPADMARFRERTLGGPVAMGRKTYDSIGRALPKRSNIVITRDPLWSAEGVERADSLGQAAEIAQRCPSERDQLMVIGGAEIYALAMPLANELLITEIEARFNCDAFFPDIDPAVWRESSRERFPSSGGAPAYSFVHYQRR